MDREVQEIVKGLESFVNSVAIVLGGPPKFANVVFVSALAGYYLAKDSMKRIPERVREIAESRIPYRRYWH